MRGIQSMSLDFEVSPTITIFQLLRRARIESQNNVEEMKRFETDQQFYLKRTFYSQKSMLRTNCQEPM